MTPDQLRQLIFLGKGGSAGSRERILGVAPLLLELWEAADRVEYLVETFDDESGAAAALFRKALTALEEAS